MADTKQKKSIEKGSLKKEIGLIILTVVATAIFTVLTTLYLSRYQQPSIAIQKSSNVSWIRENKELVGVSKIVITNNNLTTIHNLRIPISKDIYITNPTIVVDTFTKNSINQSSFFSTVEIESLAPNKHTIITILGVFRDEVKQALTDSIIPVSDYLSTVTNDKITSLPFVGNISADEGISMTFSPTNTKEILNTEITEGYVVNRFAVISVDDGENKALYFPEYALKNINKSPQPTKPVLKGSSFIPGFNTELIILGATDDEGKTIGAISGFESITSKAIIKSGVLNIKYIDLMASYYENYNSELGLNIKTTDPNEKSKHKP